MVFHFELRLDIGYEQLTQGYLSKIYTFGAVVMCAGAWCIVFPLGASMHYALVYGIGVTGQRGVWRFLYVRASA